MNESKENIYQIIRYSIIANEFSPGSRLTESELMDHFGIGRTPLRDVLTWLERDGLINRYPRSGIFVAQLDIHGLRQIIEIRMELEPFAGRLAAERIDSQQLQKMKALVARIDCIEPEDESLLGKLTRCEFDFHHLLYAATQNEKLTAILNELHGISARFWNYLVLNKSATMEQIKDVGKMAAILAQGDQQQADSVMRAHILRFVEWIKTRVVETI